MQLNTNPTITLRKILKHLFYSCFLIAFTLLTQGCHTTTQTTQDGPPTKNINVANIANPTPRNEPKSRYGNPKSYVIHGKRYYVLPTAKGYDKRGIASWYGTKFHGRLTSSREPYDMLAMTAASPELPIPCYVSVTNLENGRQIIVRVNDRGPFAPNRIIDLSYAAAKKLNMTQKGTALVEVRAISSHQDLPVYASTKQQTISTKKTTNATQLAISKLYLQVGAFHDKSNAIQLKNRLEKLTHKTVRIITKHPLTNPLYLVQVGPLKGVGESDQLLAKLQNAGYYQSITIIG